MVTRRRSSRQSRHVAAQTGADQQLGSPAHLVHRRPAPLGVIRAGSFSVAGVLDTR